MGGFRTWRNDTARSPVALAVREGRAASAAAGTIRRNDTVERQAKRQARRPVALEAGHGPALLENG
jgi:hypothetical protein